ncbi:hypothetical protein ACE418_02920 [Megasphaera sp. WILCCON 0056]|uniref:hypothetical protein n=1 Tax=Megasphaera sp. WILCCON 0056 TaxID=3345340 RepID=UPI003A7F712F
MDNLARFHNDISNIHERMDIGEELIMIGQRVHCGRLETIGNEMLDSRDDDYVDFDSLVGAFQLALWTIEDELNKETREELDELLTRAEMAKGAA